MRMHELLMIGALGVGWLGAPGLAIAQQIRSGPEEAKSPKRDERAPSPGRPGEQRPEDRRDRDRERPGDRDRDNAGQERGPHDKDTHVDRQDGRPPHGKAWGRRGSRTPPPDVKQGREDLGKTREKRAKERREELRREHGNEVARKEVREEIETHEKRLAYLNYLKQAAQARRDSASVSRATSLIQKENVRHQQAMQKLTGGNR